MNRSIQQHSGGQRFRPVGGDVPWRHVLSWAAGRASARRLSTLIFHRVLPQPDNLFPGEMHAARFDALCRWLRACFDVMPLGEGVRRLFAGTLPPRPLCITFDDGYADNAVQALPILLRHQLPATFFISTGFLGGGCMFNDRVIEAIRRTQNERVNLSFLGVEGLEVRELGRDDSRTGLINAVIRAIKHRPPHERDRMTSLLSEGLGVSVPTDLMMSLEQVRQLVHQGMEIGAHTRTHPILAGLSRQAIEEEIIGGRQDLERIIGRSVSVFAYPNGRPDEDYTREAVDVVRMAGFEAAVTTAWGAASVRSDPHQLPRFTPWDANPSRFALRLLQNLRSPVERVVA